ncbi:TadE/TadG family type IV pilus assembly protein [Wenxinia saemankumensis]|uniref:TadE-like protein n=1 Tax=Wenxinia saemankumensis TaxID=1447782 RepID=A0A1M6GZJ0_9RHOB|nr:hypothetical protein [Wenxinia saemankumensis]SHJ15334.1 hypothetical protein SAMN05444417_3018 [Wenxinia saemankumensis]
MIGRFVKGFLASEEGTATLEFCLYFVPVMYIFFTGLELGLVQTRHVMLERSLDLAVRDVRLGRLTPVNHATLSERVCSYNPLLSSCADLRLEMERLDPRDLTLIADDADCADRGDDEKPIRSSFDRLDGNQMAILRACALFDPMFPGAGLGASIYKESEGAYGLIATSLFVVEPRE